MFENTAPAEELIIVVGVEVVMGEDLLLLGVLGVGLEEWIEPGAGDLLGREGFVVGGAGLRTAISHFISLLLSEYKISVEFVILLIKPYLM